MFNSYMGPPGSGHRGVLSQRVTWNSWAGRGRKRWTEELRLEALDMEIYKEIDNNIFYILCIL